MRFPLVLLVLLSFIPSAFAGRISEERDVNGIHGEIRVDVEKDRDGKETGMVRLEFWCHKDGAKELSVCEDMGRYSLDRIKARYDQELETLKKYDKVAYPIFAAAAVGALVTFFFGALIPFIVAMSVAGIVTLTGTALEPSKIAEDFLTATQKDVVVYNIKDFKKALSETLADYSKEKEPDTPAAITSMDFAPKKEIRPEAPAADSEPMDEGVKSAE